MKIITSEIYIESLFEIPDYIGIVRGGYAKATKAIKELLNR